MSIAVPSGNRDLRLLLAGGFTIGLLDLALACTFWGLRGVAPVRIAQSIAAGLLGERAFTLGATSAVLGIVLHFAIATAFVFAYRLALARHPGLGDHPVRNGLAYGAVLFLVMNYVVLPLSAAGPPAFQYRDWLLASILVHLAIGVLCVFFARAAFSGRRPAPSVR